MRDNLPLVSVIIPTYNRPKMLVEAIQSVLNQSYDNCEIIVINDAEINLENLISTLNQKRNISYIKHSRNKGLAAARNSGVKIANGKYIAYLDDDDIYYPNHIEILVKHLEKGDYCVAYTDAYKAIQTWENNKYNIIKKDLPNSYDFDCDHILTENYIPVLCVMHRKECIDNVGMYDENLQRTEDWDLWIRMSRLYKFSHIREVTCEFRWRDDGTSMMTGEKLEFFWATLNMFHKYTTFTEGKSKIIKRHNAIIAEAIKSMEAAAEESLCLPDAKTPRLFCIDRIEETITILDFLKNKYPDNLLAINRIIDFLKKRMKVIQVGDESVEQEGLSRNVKYGINKETEFNELDTRNVVAKKDMLTSSTLNAPQENIEAKTDDYSNGTGGVDYPQNRVIFYERRIENLEERLNFFLHIFYNSNGGRLLLRYYKLRDRFFPELSRQKKIVSNISKFAGKMRNMITHRK